MSDELQPFRGQAKRTRPIFEDGPAGPWKARVRVVAIEGLSIASRLEVIAEWTGPGLPGLPPADDVEAQDVYDLPPDKLQLARATAIAALELLREGEVPFLRHVATALTFDGPSWRLRYRGLVGDTGKDPGGLGRVRG